MGEKNKKLPGHKWRVVNTFRLDGSGRYVYECSKCKQSTLDGKPWGLSLMICQRSKDE